MTGTGAVGIEPVETRRQRQRFIRLPWRIYADDPCWMPPLVQAQEELLDFRPHPFYERSRCRSFLAVRGGRDVGRITAIVNAGHVERYKEPLGFFGFFECDDDERRETAGTTFASKRRNEGLVFISQNLFILSSIVCLMASLHTQKVHTTLQSLRWLG